MTLPLPQFAAEEFRRRQAAASQAVAQGRMSPGAADRHLRPWLAIAAAMGADLPELVEEVPFWRQGFTGPRGMFGLPGWREETRRIEHWAICPPAEYRETLARARDACLREAKETPYARGIYALATALHCGIPKAPPERPQQRQAA